MVKLIQGCCVSRMIECCELPHSKVKEISIKVKLYDCLRETVANRTQWLDCRMAKQNLAGKCLNHGTVV
jgi:hypothetical protein